MSTSQGLTGYSHPTAERTKLNRMVMIILPIILMVVVVFCCIFLWIVPASQQEYPDFEQVESATVTSRLNATVSEWNITLFAINPTHRRISIKDLEALAIYGNRRLRFNTSPVSVVLNKKSQTLLNMMLATTVDYDSRRKEGFLSFGLQLSDRVKGYPWIPNCFRFECDPINLRFNDNMTATMNKHAQCFPAIHC